MSNRPQPNQAESAPVVEAAREDTADNHNTIAGATEPSVANNSNDNDYDSGNSSNNNPQNNNDPALFKQEWMNRGEREVAQATASSEANKNHIVSSTAKNKNNNDILHEQNSLAATTAVATTTTATATGAATTTATSLSDGAGSLTHSMRRLKDPSHNTTNDVFQNNSNEKDDNANDNNPTSSTDDTALSLLLSPSSRRLKQPAGGNHHHKTEANDNDEARMAKEKNNDNNSTNIQNLTIPNQASANRVAPPKPVPNQPGAHRIGGRAGDDGEDEFSGHEMSSSFHDASTMAAANTAATATRTTGTATDKTNTEEDGLIQAELVKVYIAAAVLEEDDMIEEQDPDAAKNNGNGAVNDHENNKARSWKRRFLILLSGVVVVGVIVAIVATQVGGSSSKNDNSSSTAIVTLSDRPTSSPIVIPTIAPNTYSPTGAPIISTNPPSQSLAPSLSAAPSGQPSMACDIEVIYSALMLGEPVSACEERPTRLVMRYKGGNCASSQNCQAEPVSFCEEFEGGSSLPEVVNIVAFGTNTPDIPLFSGQVRLTDEFDLAYTNGGLLDADLVIETYHPSGNNQLLERVIIHTSCSQPLFCLDVFGAYELVQFTNDLYGEVSCLLTLPFPFTINNYGAALQIERVSFQFSSSTTDATGLVGTILDQENPIWVSFEETINPRLAVTYQFNLMVSAATLSTGELCVGTLFRELTIFPSDTTPACYDDLA